MNKADSRRLEEIFVSKGYKVSEDADKADIIVVNTCSVREHAESRAKSYVGRTKFKKAKNPDLKICIVGCMAQRMGKKLINDLPVVDLVVGPSNMFRLPDLLEEGEIGAFLDSAEALKEFSQYIAHISDKNRQFSGYVPVMKGCNNFCAYCIVPYVRGREQYRDVEDIINECRMLSEKGVREIMLLGQTVNSHPDFKDILIKTAALKGLDRIRFVTSYPGLMDRKIVDIVSKHKNLCNYFHIPVQSGSDRILKSMGRKYTVKDFEDIALYIRKTIPIASITSDFIVGFPGETEEDFSKTLELVEKIEFDQCFTFKYSPRPGTRAANLIDEVPENTKKERLARLNELCTKVALARNKLMLGKKQEVIIETEDTGRTDNYKIVCWDNDIDIDTEKAVFEITEANPHSLKGKLDK